MPAGLRGPELGASPGWPDATADADMDPVAFADAGAYQRHLRSIQDEEWQLVLRPPTRDREKPLIEIYHLPSDPLQLRDVASEFPGRQGPPGTPAQQVDSRFAGERLAAHRGRAQGARGDGLPGVTEDEAGPPPFAIERVSVVIPCLNAAATLGAQLDALGRQTWQGDVEVLVGDNGSTDGSVELAESFRDRLPGLRVVSAADRGGPCSREERRGRGGDRRRAPVLRRGRRGRGRLDRRSGPVSSRATRPRRAGTRSNG